MSTVLFQMDPGAVVPFHEHTGLEQTFMLEGSLEDEEGKAFPGTYVWRPGGSRHIAVAPNGATFLSMFMSPNHFFSGEKYDLK
jgi:anti-sigma factor ChrR (cupin superfamily)